MFLSVLLRTASRQNRFMRTVGHLIKAHWCLAKFTTLHKTKSGQKFTSRRSNKSRNTVDNELNNNKNPNIGALPVCSDPQSDSALCMHSATSSPDLDKYRRAFKVSYFYFAPLTRFVGSTLARNSIAASTGVPSINQLELKR